MTARSHRIRVFLIICLITVGFYWKIILTHQFSLLMGYEGANQAYAWLNYLVTSLRQGVLPIWDPFTFSGHPFAGEMQTGAFYPPYFAFMLVPLTKGMMSPQLYHYFYVLTHIFCAWFMYLLARELGLGNFAGLVAGICFSLGGFNARLPGWPHLLESAIWLPLTFLLLLRALRRESCIQSVTSSALGGLALAMSILAGGLHVVIMQIIVVISAAAFYSFRCNREAPSHDRGRAARFAIVVAVCLGFALGGGAVQLLPSAEYSRQAIRFVTGAVVPASGRIPYAYLTDNLKPQGIVSMVVPFFSGNPSTGEFINPYIGVFPLALAIIGVATSWFRPWVRYLSGLAIAAFVFSMGNISLLHGLLYALVPFLSMAREAERFLYLADFAIAILAAYGIESMLTSGSSASWEPAERVFRWLAIASAGFFVYPLLLGKGDTSPWISLSLLLIIVSYALFRYLISGHTGIWPQFFVLTLILFDLGAFDWSAANRIQEAAKGTDQLDRLLKCHDLATFLRSQQGLFRVVVAGDFMPNIGDAFGIESMLGNGVTLQEDYSHLKNYPNLLNVRYTVRPASFPDPGAIYSDSQWKVYANAGSYPRAWLVHQVLVEPDSKKVFGLLAGDHTDLHHVAITNAPLPDSLNPAPATGTGEQVHVREENQRIEADVNAEGPALLVLSENFYPGWRATVNQKPVRIWKVDGGLRGIVVPSGKSQIELRYSPASFHIGFAISVLTWIAGVVLFVRFRAAGARSPNHWADKNTQGISIA